MKIRATLVGTLAILFDTTPATQGQQPTPTSSGEPVKLAELVAEAEPNRTTPEMELYEIADLSTIWVNAEIYEYEVPYVRAGQAATMRLSYYPGRSFSGRVTVGGIFASFILELVVYPPIFAIWKRNAEVKPALQKMEMV